MRYAIKVSNETYPITQDEVPKVLEAMATNSIVILKTGAFKGNFISSIVRDIHGEKGYNYFYRLQGGDEIRLGDMETDIPKQLQGKKDIKLIE